MTIDWQTKKFNELSPIKMHAIYQLRAEVFVVEQECIYNDIDNKDPKGIHLMGFDFNNELVAYCRILPEGVSFKEVSIGRVVTAKRVRKNGMGRLLMEKALEEVSRIYGNVPVRIGAQYHLKDFYFDFGFDAIGEQYLEDNIPHIEMLKPVSIPT